MSVSLSRSFFSLRPVNGTDKKFTRPAGTKQLFDLKQDLLAVVLFILLISLAIFFLLYFLGRWERNALTI